MKRYKKGDRVFFECFDGSIDSKIVIDVEECEGIIDVTNKTRKYQMLCTGDNMWIENYNCLNPSDTKCKELAKKYKEFDKKKINICGAIEEALEPLSNDLKKELLTEIMLKL